MKKDVNDSQPKNVWLRIGKLFLEFLVAAVTALVTTLSGQACNLW